MTHGVSVFGVVVAALMAACVDECSSRPPAVLLPAASAAGSNTVNLLAVTTRRPVADASQMFGGGCRRHECPISVSSPRPILLEIVVTSEG
jgi:esterase/lipase superfamily enzyme